jgi:tellurite resistance protein
MDKYLADAEWLAFLVKYCAGRNISSAVCRDVLTWVIVAAAVIAMIALMIIAAWLMKKLRAYLWRKSQLKVADTETMKQYRWTGDDKKR